MHPIPAETSPEVTTAKLDLGDIHVAQALFGGQNEHLKLIERRLGIRIAQRGTELRLSGAPDAVAFAARLLEQLEELIRAGRPVHREDVEQAIKVLGRQGDEAERTAIKDLFLGPVLRGNRRHIAPKSLNQKRYIDAIREHDIVFGIGPAGTGKTYLAMAMAVAFLQERKVKRIVLCRPAVEAGEKLGFLPGDLAEKVNPYLRPLYDALNDMMDPDRAVQLIENGTVEVAPLAFMRGRTLNDAFVILDEAQNTTVEQMKMFLTRLGFNSKAVVTGDVTQVDLPTGRISGLQHARDTLRSVEGIQVSLFTEVDVVRHPLVQEVIKAYERAEAEAKVAADKAAAAAAAAAAALPQGQSQAQPQPQSPAQAQAPATDPAPAPEKGASAAPPEPSESSPP